jgi:hypothetical protein
MNKLTMEGNIFPTYSQLTLGLSSFTRAIFRSPFFIPIPVFLLLVMLLLMVLTLAL